MATQAQVRQRAKERVRDLRRGLKPVDTTLEKMDRRLNKLLERETLIQIESFDSLLTDFDSFVKNIQEFERLITNVMIVFRIGF